MVNDRDDKFEGQDESEYHFSDEEVSYEVEPEHEAAKQPAEGGGGEAKESIINRLTRSKRMLISLGVFLVLVVVVYKMVAPTTSVPSTDITSAPVMASQQNAMPATGAQAPGAAAVQNQPASVAANTAAQAPAAILSAPAGQPGIAPAGQVPASEQVTQAAMVQPSVTAPSFQNVPVTPQPGSLQQAAQPQTMAQQQAIQQPGGIIQQLQQNVPIVANLPGVIPVQSSPAQATGYNAVPTGMQPATTPAASGGVDAKTAMLAAQSDQLMNQLQNQYSRQMSDFDSKNKALQDQLQSLTARVSVMENQLNQLVQVLTRRTQGGSSQANPVAPAQLPAAADMKIAYNVQAIIPGRAWLKSDNGETLTVAEGDMIKDVGRVTKIDPYDGIVEINTGSKAVSLSYGNGG
ncbi:hypothetical protein AQUSIP_20060 [Aquicella siphonis]|uniref:Uncharacterized protein n=1 Tax=Aquicella siphonis TaxID=254247 RepID=A0A5E4PK53_9COXI|nr:hypothetical protein [Aquicella siphonis]VVC76682.1 hypothetical protein AQUSIP_20060 [Aquicella siphonis]